MCDPDRPVAACIRKNKEEGVVGVGPWGLLSRVNAADSKSQHVTKWLPERCRIPSAMWQLRKPREWSLQHCIAVEPRVGKQVDS